MILEWTVGAVGYVIESLFLALPQLPWPDFIDPAQGAGSCSFGDVTDWQIGCHVRDAGGNLAEVNNWVAVDAILTAMEFAMFALVAALGIRLVRVLVSHFTGGGGAS